MTTAARTARQNPPVVSRVNDCEYRRHYAVSKGREHEAAQEADGTGREFHPSNCIADAPFVKLQSLMFAAIAMRPAQGQKEPPNEGTTTDIDTVAHLSPYCDAMFMDKGCRSLLLDVPTALRPTETAKVFSLTWRAVSRLFALNSERNICRACPSNPRSVRRRPLRRCAERATRLISLLSLVDASVRSVRTEGGSPRGEVFSVKGETWKPQGAIEESRFDTACAAPSRGGMQYPPGAPHHRSSLQCFPADNVPAFCDGQLGFHR